MIRPLLTGIFFIASVFVITPAASAQVCTPGPLQKVQELKLFGCDLEQMAHDCQTWFQKNPDTLAYAKNCKSPIDLNSSLGKTFGACKEAFGDAWFKKWTLLLASMQKKGKFYDACENDPELLCKRQLARESYFQYRNDQELRETSTGDLVKKRERVIAMAARDPVYRRKLEAAGVPLPALTDGFKDASTALVLAAVREKMRQVGVKFQCYNDLGYQRMACFALANLVDPATAAGASADGAAQGAQWARAALSIGP